MTPLWNSKIGVILLICILPAAIGMGFQDSSKMSSRNQLVITDTAPAKKEVDKSMQEFEKQMEHFDVDMQKMEKQLQDIDFDKISRQVQEAIKKIDFDKIKLDVERSLKQVDMQKIKSEIERSLKDINYEKINANVQRSIKEATASLNREELRKELEQVKTLDLQKLKTEMKHAAEELEINKYKIRDEINKLRAESQQQRDNLTGIKTMTSEMEKDGLLIPGADYTIEYKDKVLTINGKKQPQEIVDKYKKYFKGENFKIHNDMNP